MNKGFFSNWIVKNLIWGAVTILGIMVAAGIFLAVFTRHKALISVPDLTNMELKEAVKMAHRVDLKAEAVDSIYMRGVGKGAVIRQNPVPGSSVKKGRRIHLTINAVNPKQIPMPSLVGFSMRSAAAELSSRGLNLGRLIYINDIATNNVLRQLHNGHEIEAGEMLPAESTVDIVVGLSENDNSTAVPSVVGLHYRDAVDKIHFSSLNVGRLYFDRGIRTTQDSLAAMVYRQTPAEGVVHMGSGVSLSLTLDISKLPSAQAKE